MGYASATTYAGVTIRVRNTTPTRRTAPFIQKCGGEVKITPTSSTTKAWHLVLDCVLVGTATNIDTWRTTLQAADDDKLEHAFVDGRHDGNYVCLNLSWKDNPAAAAGVTNQPFTMTLLEKKFSGGY